ncbi:MAG TPA: LuxR C-terminal-related transcriptional regulator [Anaerolineae bacterium]|nr:LuxR C-terminal-related transcriptional regulator [Anaerolineae bacterium]
MVLLATKLYLPAARTGSRIVPRPRLIERLNEALARPLLLISAPAGCGKTTLLGDWIAHNHRRVAWLSLDEGDNDPTRFWTYFIAALQTVQADFGESVQAILQETGQQPIPLESFLTVLLNEMAASREGFALVLDDYHVVTTPAIHEGLTFLLDHLPPETQVIIASRADPPLPLARLRASNRMAEFRADDLRFTPDEVAVFLNQVMGLDLSADDIAALEARTEGWIAGLQLAALSLLGRDETAKRHFVSTFTGSQRYILDYLVEEVLQRQPETTQAFLLQTSILARLSGSLCDAVTGRADGQAMLEELERANLFLIPLDEDRRWYRYHHLFAEALRLRLQQAAPGRVAEIHRKAATWSEEHGLIDDAVHHALEAGDTAWAAQLVEQHVEEVLSRGEGETLRRWLAAVTQAAVRSRPRLALAQAIAAFNTGRLEAVEPLLEDAERALATTPSEPYTPSIGREVSMLANVPATIALLRASLVGLRGDAERMTELVRLALTHLTEDERGPHISVRWNLALADWMRGRLAEAERAFAGIVAEGRVAGEPHLMLSAGSVLGRVQRAQGRLDAALRTYQKGLEFAAQTGSPVVLSAAMAHMGMAEVLYERNQLEQALRHVTEGISLGRQLTSTQSLATGLATLAWIRQARGDPAGALEAMDEAYQVMPALEVVALHNPVPAERARLWLAQGDVMEAARWVEAQGLEEDAELSYPRECEYLVLARVLLARNMSDRALSLLERLGSVAEAQARTGSVIEVRVLKALALKAIGEQARALAVLVEALTLAGPEGYVRVFVDEGKPVAGLLQQVTGEQWPYAERLLAVLAKSEQGSVEAPTHPPVSPPIHAQSPALIEPLSPREMEVLRLIAAGLSTAQIADELVITVGTVRNHLKNIYGKLDTHSRVQAVERARALKLL